LAYKPKWSVIGWGDVTPLCWNNEQVDKT